MPLEEAIKQLEIHAKKFEEVGDVKTFIQTNKTDFLHRFAKVSQYYHYIKKQTDSYGEFYDKTLEILTKIIENNPSISDFVDIMLLNNQIKQVPETKKEATPSKVELLTKQIEQLIENINEVGYRPEEFDDMEWALEDKKRELLELKDEFTLTEYERLLKQLDNKLDNIYKVTKIQQGVTSHYDL